MGCMGMSLDDFCRCTPSEFYAVWEAWNENRSQSEHGMWERARMLAFCTLQPYMNKKLRPQDIMQFPWDKENQKLEAKREDSNGEENLSREEFMERYRKARERRGLG